MKKVLALVVGVAAIMVLAASCAPAIPKVTLPEEAVELSELVPGMGEHWANPANMPVGPIYLVHDEEVIGVEYMFTTDLMEEVTVPTPEGEETFKHLPELPVGAYVDHMEIEFFSQGHEGFEVSHFDAHLYFISLDERQEELVPHAHQPGDFVSTGAS